MIIGSWGTVPFDAGSPVIKILFYKKMSTNKYQKNGCTAGADPGAGKGRSTNRLNCRWLDSLVSYSCCIANNHLLVVSHY